MENNKQHNEYLKGESWTEEQEKDYWHGINKSHDEHSALNNLEQDSVRSTIAEATTAKEVGA